MDEEEYASTNKQSDTTQKQKRVVLSPTRSIQIESSQQWRPLPTALFDSAKRIMKRRNHRFCFIRLLPTKSGKSRQGQCRASTSVIGNPSENKNLWSVIRALCRADFSQLERSVNYSTKQSALPYKAHHSILSIFDNSQLV